MKRVVPAALACAALVGSVLLAPGAGADPTPAGPTPSSPTPSSPTPAGPTSGSTVLIVHVDGGTGALAQAAADSPLAVRHTFGALHAFSVAVPAGQGPAEAAKLNALPDVASVEATVSRQFDGSAATDDPDLARQEPYLDAVHAPAAWARQKASPAVKIAIVDSGVDVDHPDLQGKVLATYNAVNNSTNVTDTVGHGTFVAGVAAADTDNGIGVAGAGYDADILAVKIAGPDGTIAIDDEVAGIKWAADHGANIINLSLGGPDSSPAERSAVAYAQHKGALVVAAAGNESSSVEQYPAGYPGVVAVGATDTAHGTRAAFSSYGSWVTLAAPGVNIYSTVPRAGSTFWPKSEYPTGYADGDGTSFSTPIVSGAAALLKAQNPTLSAATLRADLVASAHGYAGRGLGAGQVDFTAALAHVAPRTAPSATHVDGTAGTVHLVASSSAPDVVFRIDGQPIGRLVRVSKGQATSSFATWGYANGPHRLDAYDCTPYGECNPAPRAAAFTLANRASAITTPSPGSTVTGEFTVRAGTPGGGPLRLLIDGRPAGLVRAAPYAFASSASALSDARHTLATQACSADGRRCLGPRSATVTVTAAGLHPTITRLTPAQISPNDDHVKDTATLSFHLPDTEDVHVLVLNAAGRVVHGGGLGTLRAGTHTWTWWGKQAAGQRLPDGTYTLALQTEAGARRGWVTRSGVIDTRAPRLTRPSGVDKLFYPYPDGYRDTFTTRTALSDAATLTLTVRSAKGKVVRTVSAARKRGVAAIDWNGRDQHGRLVPAGTYRFSLSATDAAGNRSHTARYRVRVSRKKLVTQTLYVSRRGTSYRSAGGTAGCASAHRTGSIFAHGTRLVNACARSDFDLAFADYSFTVPKAIRYTRLAIQVQGRSKHRPSELTAAFEASDGGVAIPGYRKIDESRVQWYTIASVSARGQLGPDRRVQVSVLLDSAYRGTNDFDISHARLRVTARRLR